MCQAIQEMRMEERRIGELEGKLEGELKKANEVTINLYRLGMDIENIAKAVDYPVETVKEWLELKQP